MSKYLTEISSELTIPGFDVKVKTERACQVKSKDGRHKFSAKISHGIIKISGPMFPKPLIEEIGPWEWNNNAYEYATGADDVITQVAKALQWLDVFSKDGFSAKIAENTLILSHSSKPDYSLRIWITDVRKWIGVKNTPVYTLVEYCGPAYDRASNTKWGREAYEINCYKLVAIDKEFKDLTQELKTRVLNLGEEKDPRIVQWVANEIEKDLQPLGFAFTAQPENALVEFSHPAGLSGSFAFAPFNAGYDFRINQKFPDPHFPADLTAEKVVLFTCKLLNSPATYTKSWLVNRPKDAINNIRGVLALTLVYQEVCKEWKSDILIPKLNGNNLQLVNTKSDYNSTIFELTPDRDTLLLISMDTEVLEEDEEPEQLSYPFSNIPTVVDTKEITKVIVDRADKHVQDFIKRKGIKLTHTAPIEIDF
jgi:hypothetical protein